MTPDRTDTDDRRPRKPAALPLRCKVAHDFDYLIDYNGESTVKACTRCGTSWEEYVTQ